MICNELAVIETKLQKLFDILSLTIPAKHIQDHPFSYYRSIVSSIESFIDKVLEESLSEKLLLESEIKSLEAKICEYSISLGLPQLKKHSISNLNLLKEYLENEMKRIEIVRARAESEIRLLIEQINDARTCIGLEKLSVELEEISIDRITRLRMQLSNILLEKEEREKQRQSLYDEIESISKMMQEPVSFRFDEKICDLESDLRILKKTLQERREAVQNKKEQIKRLEKSLKVEHREFPDEFVSANIESIDKYLKHLKDEQERLFDEIFERTRDELDEINSTFGIERTEYPREEKYLEIMRDRINEMLPKREMFCEIKSLIDKRKLLIEKMTEFEKIASDPKRLFKSSFQLNSEEKFRNTAYPSLLKLEENIFELLGVYEQEFGMFLFEGREFKDALRYEVENRIVNRTIFISRCDSPYRKKK